jgi:ABC-type uncharacterized transport system ATPase component
MITKDGYAAVPWGERYVIIHNGFQIADVDTADEAVAFIREQQTKTKTNKKSKSKGRLTLD